MFQDSFNVNTKGRGSYSLVDEIASRLQGCGIKTGICQIFVHHTSASLMLCENADPEVRADMERFMARLVPDGDPLFKHIDEGPDDMPAHVRSILTGQTLGIPIVSGRADLGVWQGIYLWEHRQASHQRRLTITLIGE